MQDEVEVILCKSLLKACVLNRLDIVVGDKNCNHFLRRHGVKRKRNCERIYVFQRG